MNFFSEFPEFHDRALFLVGESYAGTYVPLLAQKVGGARLRPVQALSGTGPRC